MSKKLLAKIGTGLAAGSMLLATAAPAAFADTSVIVAGNARSVNTVTITKIDTTTIIKNNIAAVTNIIVTNQNSGQNTTLGGGYILSGGNAATVKYLYTY